MKYEEALRMQEFWGEEAKKILAETDQAEIDWVNERDMRIKQELGEVADAWESVGDRNPIYHSEWTPLVTEGKGGIERTVTNHDKGERYIFRVTYRKEEVKDEV